VFHRAAEMRARFDVPVLGIVSRALSQREMRQRRLDAMRFGAASGSLVVMFLVGLSIMTIMAGR